MTFKSEALEFKKLDQIRVFLDFPIYLQSVETEQMRVILLLLVVTKPDVHLHKDVGKSVLLYKCHQLIL
jgi:hypothetical protein